MIWFKKDLGAADMSLWGKGTMAEYIGFEFTEVGPDFLKGRIPVDHRTNQPYGILHGGASCVLAETLGSVASACVVDHANYFCVGLEINANHIRSVRSGYVTGTARPLHLGRKTHIWEIKIEDERGKLTCVSRLTVMIVPREEF